MNVWSVGFMAVLPCNLVIMYRTLRRGESTAKILPVGPQEMSFYYLSMLACYFPTIAIQI